MCNQFQTNAKREIKCPDGCVYLLRMRESVGRFGSNDAFAQRVASDELFQYDRFRIASSSIVSARRSLDSEQAPFRTPRILSKDRSRGLHSVLCEVRKRSIELSPIDCSLCRSN